MVYEKGAKDILCIFFC